MWIRASICGNPSRELVVSRKENMYNSNSESIWEMGMSIESYESRLRGLPVDEARLLSHESMARHTTFRIGGPADLFLSVATEQEAAAACALAQEECVPITVIGNGSNLLVTDKGIRGLVLCLGRDFQRIWTEGGLLCAQAGASLKAVAQRAMLDGRAGLEAVSGSPGNVGGAVCMNAGAYGGMVSQHLEWVRMLDPRTGEIRRYTRQQMEFGYRTSLAMARGMVVLSAAWLLSADEPEAIRSRMEEYTRRRREKQPLSYPSAGSVFKRPEGYFAGKLIEDAGLKGYSVGQAQVSDLHAGFIINKGGATAQDVIALMEHIQRVVREKYGVELEPEIRRIGE